MDRTLHRTSTELRIEPRVAGAAAPSARRRAPRRRTATMVAVAMTAALLPGLSHAWGREGHAIVADIAEARLTPAATRDVAQLLQLDGAKRMSDVSSWADEIRGEDPDGPMHSVRLPLDHTPYNAERFCSKQHLCAVGAVEQNEATLRDKCAPPADRERALKYVIHLVGDLHQPLHAVQAYKAQVTFQGKQWGLHKFWDTILIRQLKESPDAAARDIMASAQNLNDGGTAADWAMESRDVARDQIDPKFSGVRNREFASSALDRDYVSQALPIARQRLALAGVRLARTLNESFAAADADTRSCSAAR